jgi:heterodisulfide reductase subunit B
MGINIVTVCNGCTENLTKTIMELRGDSKLREEVNVILASTGRKFQGTSEVKHYVRMLKEDVGLDKIRSLVKTPFKNIKVGAHYGCHLLRPSEVMNFEDPNNPKILDDLINVTGAESIDYLNKTECCAGPVMGIRESVTWSVGLDKVETIKTQGDVMVTCCPFCYLTFERCQFMTEKQPNLPVIHIPQLIGLSMGLSPEDVGLSGNKVDSSTVIERRVS